jgi:sugar/nucleoside kinase (ribokinase family)
VVVTCGAEGADLYRPPVPVHHQDAFSVAVVDTTGAGDAFSGTLAWALLDGRSIEESVRAAAAAGALATRGLGARSTLATERELDELARGR